MTFAKYGLIQLPMSIVEVFLRLYLLVYFTQKINLSGQSASLLISSSLIVSTFFDSFLGKHIDHFDNKVGKIKWPIYLAFVVMAISLFLLFIPQWSENNIMSLFFICLLYQLSYSAYFLPYISMAKKLVRNEQDIISLYSWRFLWGSLGAILGVGLPLVLSYYKQDYYLELGWILMGLVLVWGPLTLTQIKIKHHSNSNSSINIDSYLNELKEVSSNKSFRSFIAYYIILSIGFGLFQTLSVYFYRDGIGLSPQHTNMLLGFSLGMFCLSLPFWTKWAKKYGEIINLKYALGSMILLALSYPFLSKENMPSIIIVVLIGGILSGVVCLNDPYLSKVIDYHSLKFKKKRSNFIFGVFRTSDKIARSIGIYLAGLIVDMTVKLNTPNPIGFNLSQWFTIGLIVFFVPALIIVSKQKLTHAKHGIVMRYLRKKNKNLIYSSLDSV